MTPVTQDDLKDLAADIKDYIRERCDASDAMNAERFADIRARVDKTNGNVMRHEASIAEQRAKISVLNKEIFERPRRVRESDAPKVSDDDKPALTKGGVRRAIGVVAALGAIAEGAHRLSDFVLAYVQHGLK